MQLKLIDRDLSVCKLNDLSDFDMRGEIFFIGKTDEELSLVCETSCVPENVIARDDNWQGFRIQGTLDFSLIGILSRISRILADNGIGIFAVSTYNTDYILVKKENLDKAVSALRDEGYSFA